MGKNLKGKEIGKGICQRKDGLYCARFVDKRGKRKEKYFNTVPEARNWLSDAKYKDRHSSIISTAMTVNDWVNFGCSKFEKTNSDSKQNNGVSIQTRALESRSTKNFPKLQDYPTHPKSC